MSSIFGKNPFKILKKSKKSEARLGVLSTPHGKIESPFFMPVATRAAIRNLTMDEMKDLGAQIILSNTYHLFLRPGMEVIKKAGGLHKFMGWPGPILTDSGGYQVFSLSKMRKIKEDGVEFQSETDGTKIFLTPEKAVEIQQILGSDIMMVLDVLSEYPSTHEEAEKAVEMTTAWAGKCKKQQKKGAKRQMLFGIVQGSVFKDLREKSIRELLEFNFDGYAIGGLTVGEPLKKTFEMVGATVPLMPEKKPRYMMGLGVPGQMLLAVKMGVDMFDCVVPTRHARHGDLFVRRPKVALDEKKKFYETVHITNAKFKKDMKPIDGNCRCFACANFSCAYLHHLFKTQEPLALRLASIHNLSFFINFMAEIRKEIKNGNL